jgi:hypothetical protein
MAPIPKIPEGRKPLELERIEKRQRRTLDEKANKGKARKRDGHKCRWPRCECQKVKLALETAHVKAKGMGGDHGSRSGTENLLTLCRLKHQGPRDSLHSGDLSITKLTPAGCDGPLEFYDNGVLVGREVAVGVLEQT